MSGAPASAGSTTAGGGGFVIRPPTTTTDPGTPSTSLSKDVDRVLRLVEDERLLTAHKLLLNVRERFKTPPVMPSPRRKRLFAKKPKVTEEMRAAERDCREAKESLESKRKVLEGLEVR